MKDKVSELRKILNQKKSLEEKQTHAQTAPEPEKHREPVTAPKKEESEKARPLLEDHNELQELKKKCEELGNANELQKDMYLRKAAEFENYKKRLQKEHDELVKFANEKLLLEIFPIIDSLEITLSHLKDENDPVAAGVKLVLKQLLQSLEKFGVVQISGESGDFNPHLQEAVLAEESKEFVPGKVIRVQRKGYTLNGKVIRAALVTVSQ